MSFKNAVKSDSSKHIRKNKSGVVGHKARRPPEYMPSEDFYEVIKNIKQRLITDTAPIAPADWDSKRLRFKHFLRNYHPEQDIRNYPEDGKDVRFHAAELIIQILDRAKDDDTLEKWFSEVYRLCNASSCTGKYATDYLMAYNQQNISVDVRHFNIFYADMKHAATTMFFGGKISRERLDKLVSMCGNDYETPFFFKLSDLFRIKGFNAANYFDSGYSYVTYNDVRQMPYLSKFMVNFDNIKEFLSLCDEDLAVRLTDKWAANTDHKEQDCLASVLPDNRKELLQAVIDKHIPSKKAYDSIAANGGIADNGDADIADLSDEKAAEDSNDNSQKDDVPALKGKVFFTDYLRFPADFLQDMKKPLNSAALKLYLPFTPSLAQVFANEKSLKSIKSFFKQIPPEYHYVLMPWINDALVKVFGANSHQEQIKQGLNEIFTLKQINPDFVLSYLSKPSRLIYTLTGASPDKLMGILNKTKASALNREETQGEVILHKNILADSGVSLVNADAWNDLPAFYMGNTSAKRKDLSRYNIFNAPSVLYYADNPEKLMNMLAANHFAAAALKRYWLGLAYKHITTPNPASVRTGVTETKVLLALDKLFVKKAMAELFSLNPSLPDATKDFLDAYTTRYPVDADVLTPYIYAFTLGQFRKGTVSAFSNSYKTDFPAPAEIAKVKSLAEKYNIAPFTANIKAAEQTGQEDKAKEDTPRPQKQNVVEPPAEIAEVKVTNLLGSNSNFFAVRQQFRHNIKSVSKTITYKNNNGISQEIAVPTTFSEYAMAKTPAYTSLSSGAAKIFFTDWLDDAAGFKTMSYQDTLLLFAANDMLPPLSSFLQEGKGPAIRDFFVSLHYDYDYARYRCLMLPWINQTVQDMFAGGDKTIKGLQEAVFLRTIDDRFYDEQVTSFISVMPLNDKDIKTFTDNLKTPKSELPAGSIYVYNLISETLESREHQNYAKGYFTHLDFMDNPDAFTPLPLFQRRKINNNVYYTPSVLTLDNVSVYDFTHIIKATNSAPNLVEHWTALSFANVVSGDKRLIELGLNEAKALSKAHFKFYNADMDRLFLRLLPIISDKSKSAIQEYYTENKANPLTDYLDIYIDALNQEDQNTAALRNNKALTGETKMDIAEKENMLAADKEQQPVRLLLTDYLYDTEGLNLLSPTEIEAMECRAEFTPSLSSFTTNKSKADSLRKLLASVPQGIYEPTVRFWTEQAFKDIIEGDFVRGIKDGAFLTSCVPEFESYYMADLFRHSPDGQAKKEQISLRLAATDKQALLTQEELKFLDSCKISALLKPKSYQKSLVTDYIGLHMDFRKLSFEDKTDILRRNNLIPDVADLDFDPVDFYDLCDYMPKGAEQKVLNHFMVQSFKNIMDGEYKKGIVAARNIQDIDSDFYAKNTLVLLPILTTADRSVKASIVRWAENNPADMDILEGYVAVIKGQKTLKEPPEIQEVQVAQETPEIQEVQVAQETPEVPEIQEVREVQKDSVQKTQATPVVGNVAPLYDTYIKMGATDAEKAPKIFFTDFLGQEEKFAKLNPYNLIEIKHLSELIPPLSDFADRQQEIRDFFPKVLAVKGSGSDEIYKNLVPWIDRSFADMMNGNLDKGIKEAVFLRSIRPNFYDNYVAALFRLMPYGADKYNKFKESLSAFKPANSEEAELVKSLMIKSRFTSVELKARPQMLISDFFANPKSADSLSRSDKETIAMRIAYVPPIEELGNTSDLKEALQAIPPHGFLKRLYAHWISQSFADIVSGDASKIAKGVEQGMAVLSLDAALYAEVSGPFFKLLPRIPQDNKNAIWAFANDNPQQVAFLEKHLLVMRNGFGKRFGTSFVRKVAKAQRAEEKKQDVKVTVTLPPKPQSAFAASDIPATPVTSTPDVQIADHAVCGVKQEVVSGLARRLFYNAVKNPDKTQRDLDFDYLQQTCPNDFKVLIKEYLDSQKQSKDTAVAKTISDNQNG